VVDSGATHHITPSVGNISTPHPLNSSNPSSIIVGNGSSLSVTSVGDSVLPRPFYLNNILLASDMVQSLLSVRRFTTDNWCSMEFDPFGLSVKDLSTQNVIVRSNSTGPLYTLRLPGTTTPSPSAMAALAAAPHALAAVAPTTWHRRLSHPGPDALSSLSRSSFIHCTSNKHEFYHACQLGKHTRLPFHSSSHRAEHPFDLIHLDLWTSPVVSVSGSKYYLVILDDFTHWTCLPKLKSDTFTTLLMCLLSSAGLSKLSSATTGVSLTTLPRGSSSYRTTHSSGYRVLTHPHKMVNLNVLFVRLTMSSALCLFRLLFPCVIAWKDFTLLRIC
jgi:hypothetical protein